MVKISDHPIGLPDPVFKSQNYVINIEGDYTIGQLIDELISWKDEFGKITVKRMNGDQIEFVDDVPYTPAHLERSFKKPETAGTKVDIMHCYASVGVFGDPRRIDYELMV